MIHINWKKGKSNFEKTLTTTLPFKVITFKITFPVFTVNLYFYNHIRISDLLAPVVALLIVTQSK